MKDSRKMLLLIRGAVKVGAFPGSKEGRNASWPRDPFHILISTVLSQRTRDRNTANASENLFQEYETPFQIANAPLKRIKESSDRLDSRIRKQRPLRRSRDESTRKWTIKCQIPLRPSLPSRWLAGRPPTAFSPMLSTSLPFASIRMCSASQIESGWSFLSIRKEPRSNCAMSCLEISG